MLVCDDYAGSLGALTEAMVADRDFDVIDVVNTGVALSRAMRDGDAGLSVLSPGVLDIDLMVDRNLESPTRPRKVLVSSSPTTALILKARHYGLDDVITLQDETGQVLQRLKKAANGEGGLDVHPVLRSLDLHVPTGGRRARVDDDDDPVILDLIGLGLSDTEIATISGLTLQRIRNRIAGLIVLNELRTRTQLVVLRATTLHIPDFS